MTRLIVRLLSCLVSKLKNLTNAWESMHTALADIVLEYEFEKLHEDDNVWIVDSGVSCHVVRNKNLLHKPIPLLPQRMMGFCGETQSRSTHIGHAYLPVKMNPAKVIRLSEVIRDEYVGNLLSVSQLTADFPMLSFEFYSTGFLLKNVKTKKVLVEGPQIGHIYFWPSHKIDAWMARANGSRLGNLMIKPSVIIKALWKLMINHYLGSLVALLMYKMQANALWALIFRCNNNLQREVADSWLVDSGSTSHCSFDQTVLRNSTKVGVKNLTCALDCGGRRAAITHIGDVYLPTQRPGREILIHGVKLIPKSIVNILSVSAMTSQFCCYFKFGSNGFVMKSLDTNKVMAKGGRRDKLYYWGK